MSKLSDILAFTGGSPGHDALREMAKRDADRILGINEANLRAAEHEAAMRLPSELDGAAAEEHAPLFLCLDLVPGYEARPPDDADTVPKVLTWLAAEQARHDGTNGRAAPRCGWRVFSTLEAAQRWADSQPTIVMMPLHIEPNPELGF